MGISSSLFIGIIYGKGRQASAGGVKSIERWGSGPPAGSSLVAIIYEAGDDGNWHHRPVLLLNCYYFMHWWQLWLMIMDMEFVAVIMAMIYMV